MYLGVELNLAYALMTLLTASKKSFSVAIFRRALIAYMPASVQTLRISAPREYNRTNLLQAHKVEGQGHRHIFIQLYHGSYKFLIA